MNQVQDETYWKFYNTANGQWRWCQVESTGYIICCSGTTFRQRADCLRDAQAHGYESPLALSHA
ncbi:MAG: hypothetical protein RR903_03970 [Edwardsiella sp. (in: enterobacteria)]